MSLKNPVTPPAIDPGTVRLVAQSLNHCATTGVFLNEWLQYFLQNRDAFFKDKKPKDFEMSRDTDTWLHPRRRDFSETPLLEPQIPYTSCEQS